MGELEVAVFFVVFALLTICALFWIIRLAVRYGVNDALRMNRQGLDTRSDRDSRTR